MSEKHIIFDCTNKDWVYLGILFAELDNREITKQMGVPFSEPKEYVAGVMALVWIDENGVWNWKMRIKFPSANKQVVSNSYDPKEVKNANLGLMLSEMKKLPLIHDSWFPNPCGTPEGLIRIMEETDMIESKTIIGMEE